MSEPNYAGDIIASLAGLPDFLRKSVLERRLAEYYIMEQWQKDEIVENALDAGPGIEFPKFARLLHTWLEAMAGLEEDRRAELFGAYIGHCSSRPDRLARFHMDGLLGVFLSLPSEKRAALAKTASYCIGQLREPERSRLLLLVPDAARQALGV